MSHNPLAKTLLAGVLLLTGSATFAQTAPMPTPAPLTVGIYATKQAEKFCLAIDKQPDTYVYVQLLAATGEALYRATLPRKSAKLRQIFDLHELTAGTYTLRIKQGKNLIIRQIQVGTTAPAPATRYLTVGE